MGEDGKKDVLDFPLEEVSIPQAIALMMQAASKCYEKDELVVDGVVISYLDLPIDNESLQLLIEKLEAYVEDKMELAAIPVAVPVIEDAPDEEFEEADEADTFLQKNDEGDILRVVHRGVVFGRLCNERVLSPDNETPEGSGSACCKEWGHDPYAMHEDKWGNRR